MVLKDSVNEYNSLYHLSLQWARADENNFTYEEFIRSFNMAINRITGIIHNHDTGWKYHDINASGELIDRSLTLTSGVTKYAISEPWLKIARIRVLQADGTTWKTLTNRDRRSLSDDELASNVVSYNYVLGNFLYLAGVPTYTKANGIEVQYQDGPVHFVPDGTDDDKEVGFNPLFEELGALMPAFDYLEINGPDEQARKVEKKIGVEPRQGMEGVGLLNDLAVSYQERNDSAQTLTLKRNNRALGLQDSGSYPLY